MHKCAQHGTAKKQYKQQHRNALIGLSESFQLSLLHRHTINVSIFMYVLNCWEKNAQNSTNIIATTSYFLAKFYWIQMKFNKYNDLASNPIRFSTTQHNTIQPNPTQSEIQFISFQFNSMKIQTNLKNNFRIEIEYQNQIKLSRVLHVKLFDLIEFKFNLIDQLKANKINRTLVNQL